MRFFLLIHFDVVISQKDTSQPLVLPLAEIGCLRQSKIRIDQVLQGGYATTLWFIVVTQFQSAAIAPIKPKVYIRDFILTSRWIKSP